MEVCSTCFRNLLYANCSNMSTNQDGLGPSATIRQEARSLSDGDQELIRQTRVMNVAQRFSTQLWVPRCQHKISKVWESVRL